MSITKENILYGIKKPRFLLWKILAVVFCLTLAFWIIGFLTVIFLPKNSIYYHGSYKNSLTFRAIFGQVIFIVFFTTFYFFVLNIYYYARVLKKQTKDYFLYSIIFISIFCTYSGIVNKLYPNNIKNNPAIGGENIWFFTIIGILVWIAVTVLILVYMLSTANAKDEKKRNQELLERNSQLEIEKLRAEYNFLKAQINPHFIHNSLNFLYSKSLPYSPELSEGILTISEIMRYALMNESNSEGLVLLSKEVEHIRNIIKMNQLRFDNKLNIHFNISGNINGVRIVPLVLITIVENAFKHGDVRSADAPLNIDLNIENDFILFSCSNKKKIGPKEASFGIGLNNTQRRLQMIYQDQATITIEDKIDTYSLQLKIPNRR